MPYKSGISRQFDEIFIVRFWPKNGITSIVLCEIIVWAWFGLKIWRWNSKVILNFFTWNKALRRKMQFSSWDLFEPGLGYKFDDEIQKYTYYDFIIKSIKRNHFLNITESKVHTFEIERGNSSARSCSGNRQSISSPSFQKLRCMRGYP